MGTVVKAIDAMRVKFEEQKSKVEVMSKQFQQGQQQLEKARQELSQEMVKLAGYHEAIEALEAQNGDDED